MKLPFRIVRTEEQEALEEELKKLRKSNATATFFIKEIENGNLDVSIDQGNGEVDELNLALSSMQLQLKKIASEEKERNWATQGLAKFSEILRTDNTDAKNFYQRLVSSLIKYLDANQGALYLINDDQQEVEIEMVACYAYDRVKYLNKKISPGEGLVGQCYLEGLTIFLTDIPQKYLKITSGLGTANPDCLIIVPLKVNDQIHGILELASFEVLRPYQVEFIERLGESIASTISTVKINQRTQKLLIDSQQQAEELRAQEEEMRQNMEEMQAIQESQSRLQNELKSQLEANESLKIENERKVEEEKNQLLAQISEERKAAEDFLMTFQENEEIMKKEIKHLKEVIENLKNGKMTENS